MKFKDIYTEEKVRLDPKCWKGKKIGNPKTKMKGGVRVNNCVPAESVSEGQQMGEYGRVLSALRLYYPDKFSMEELNTPDWHRVIANKADVPVEYAGKVIDDFTRPVDGYDDEEWPEDDDENVAEGETDLNWLRDISKEKLDALAGPRYKKQSGTGGTDPKKKKQAKKGALDLATLRAAAKTARPASDMAEDASPDFVWIQGDFDGDTAVSGPEQGSWRNQITKQVELIRGRLSNVERLDGPPPQGGKTIKQARIPLTLDAGGGQQFSTTGVDLELTVAPNGYITRGDYGRVRGTAVVKIMRPGANESMRENYNPEYDDEAGMADNNLETLKRAVEGIDDLIQSGDNLPEWCQEKIANAKSMLVAVWDYMYSEEASDEVDPEVDEMFEAMQQLVSEMAHKNRVSEDLVWESFEALPDNVLYETAAWRRKEGKSKKGGLNAKGVASYRRENPGSKLQMAVTTKPSKLKPGSKAAKRRKSFCARMSGVKGPMKKPNGKPTRKALALRKWNC